MLATNAFFWTVLGALVVEYAFDVVGELLNLKALSFSPPPPLDSLYKPEEYRDSQEYVRSTTRFGLVNRTFQLAVTLAFWFAGGFNILDRTVKAWGWPPVLTGVAYIAILGIGYMLLTLPFSIYATFSIEQRFGFNRTTPRVFVVDRLKGLALAALLGIPLLAGVLALFMYAGAASWLYCWAVVVFVSLILQYVAPTWIMPWFNKFKPLDSGELRDAIMSYARRVDYKVDNVYVMDGSCRSTRSNAFFTGFGRNKRIVLFDTLIAGHTAPELVSVLAHEIGHYKKRHILQGTVMGALQTGVLFFLLSLFLNSHGLYQAFGMEQQSVYAGLLFFGLLYTPAEFMLSLALQALSRRNEYQADRFAAETLEDPGSLEEALKKLSAKNLANLTPHPFYVFLNYSHPPLLQRILAIRRAGEKTSSRSAGVPESPNEQGFPGNDKRWYHVALRVIRRFSGCT